MPHTLRQSHGPLPSTFECGDSLRKTISLAVLLLMVLVTGIGLIVHGLS